VSVRTPAIQPASIFAHHARPRLRLVPPAAAPTPPLQASLVVSRLDRAHVTYGTCSLCWAGPGELAGSVQRHAPTDGTEQAICSRCLVTLEMLAVQFEPNLRLRIDTPA
jgi:hypothetical protein